MKERGRRAVTRQSSWRSEPAAALRGFAKGSLAGADDLPVHRLEVLLEEQHLAADLDPRRRRPGEPVRDAAVRAQAAHHPQVGGDVLAVHPVAARRALHQRAPLVDQLDREAVQLRLDHVAHRRAGGEPEQPAHARVDLAELLVGLDVAEREHGLAVNDPLEPLRRRARDALGGRVRRHQLRVLRLERLQLAHEPVVLGVREDRLVQDVVGVVRGADPLAQVAGERRRFALRHGARMARRPAAGNEIRAPAQKVVRSSSPRGGVSGLTRSGWKP